MTLLTLKSVSKSFHVPDHGTNDNITIFNDINLTINEGKLITIMGPSGCGKTTLFNLIAGFLSPNKGRIFFKGLDISTLTLNELSKYRNRYLGYLYQESNLFPFLTARENIELPAKLMGLSTQEIYLRMKNLAEELAISHRLNNRPSEISGGQQTRVGLARALINKPKLFLADEPTANLDTTTAFQIIDFLRQKQVEDNFGMIISTHDPRIAKISDEIYVIEDRKLIKVGG